MELGHVQGGGRGAGVAGSGVALAGDRGGGHVQGGLALLVVLAVTLLVQGQGQALPLLPPVAEPNSHHLRRPAHVLKPDLKKRKEVVSFLILKRVLRTSLSRPRSSEMCVISWVFGLGHFMK